jgi:spore germination protein
MIESKRAAESLLSSYRGTMYEMTGILENVEKDLDRVRISDSTPQQSRILTDLLVQARLAEADIEKLPVAAEANRNITAFVNRTAAVCEGVLGKLRHGETLSAEDRAVLDGLYKTNHALKGEIAKILENMTDEDFMQYVKKGKGAFADGLQEMEKMTLEENTVTFKKELPMSEMNKEKGDEKQGEESRVEAVKAEELCAQYFQSYDITEYQCVGETSTKDYAAYNVQGYDARGNLLFAEIDQISGKLIRFDYYEECAGDTFDLQNAERIAEDFLEKLGYDDMEVVRCRQNGSTTDFTFVYETDDILFYPDEVRVKVCRTRGVVSGMDASKYLQNHRGRDEVNAKMSLAEAYEKVYKELDVQSSRLVVIQTARGEKTAYEMLCAYQEDNYLIYLDATTGEELSIVNVNTIQ